MFTLETTNVRASIIYYTNCPAPRMEEIRSYLKSKSLTDPEIYQDRPVTVTLNTLY